MERPEVPLEHAHEHIHHHAKHGDQKWWVLGVALSSAIFAALAAVASLQAGHQINEALISQLEASDHWSYFQAKSIKGNILASRQEIMAALKKASAPPEARALETAAEGGAHQEHAAAEGGEEAKELKSVERYAEEQKEIKAEATKLEKERAMHLDRHVKMATAVTMFQICIAVSAISVLTNRVAFWYLSLLFGIAGIYYLTIGLFF